MKKCRCVVSYGIIVWGEIYLSSGPDPGFCTFSQCFAAGEIPLVQERPG